MCHLENLGVTHYEQGHGIVITTCDISLYLAKLQKAMLNIVYSFSSRCF